MEWMSLGAALCLGMGAWNQITIGARQTELTMGRPLEELRAENQLLAGLSWWRRRGQRREFREARPPELAEEMRLLECQVKGWLWVWTGTVMAAVVAFAAAVS